MGFFDRFTRTLDDWDARWADAGQHLLGSWQGIRDGALYGNAMALNVWNTAFGGKDAKENADAFWATKGFWERSFDVAGLAGQAVGGVFGAAAEMPGLRQVFAFADAAQHDLIARPVATASLVRGDAAAGGDWGIPLDVATWREAYNTTTYVTPGQAFMYASLANSQAFVGLFGQELDEAQRRDLMRQYPVVGIIAQDPKQFDPRARGSGRDAYYDNTFMKGMSGLLDAGFVVVADPTIFAGKFAVAAKARYLSKEMNAAAIAAGKLDSHVDSRSYRIFKNFVRDAENSEQVFRRALANHTQGDLAAALLYDAAKMQPAYERLGGSVDLFDTTFRALYGDVNAWDTLAGEARAYADAIGHAKATYTIAGAARNYGMGDAAVDARVNALVDTKVKAWSDATIAGHGMWGRLKDEPLLAGTTVPRLTMTSAWRTGVHSFFRNSVPTILGHWARRGAMVLPSQRSGRMLDLNDPNSSHVFRSRLSLSRLSQDELDRWAGAYARATSSEARFMIYMAAENYTLARHAERYGISQKQLEDLLPVVNQFRRGNRQILGANRRFASEDVVEAYRRRLSTAAQPGAQRINLARRFAAARAELDQAAKSGDFPSHYYTLPDEQGMLTLIPEDMNLRLDKPITIAQHADIVPLVDWHVLENALWFHVGLGRGKPFTKRPGKFERPEDPGRAQRIAEAMGRAGYSAQDLTRAFLEAVMSVWKVTAILRPGYVWRTLSDEVGRIMVKQKNFPSLASMGRAPGNISHNMWVRGRLLGDAMGRKVAAARASQHGIVEVEGEVVSVGLPVEAPAGATLAADARFDTSTPAALVDADKVYSSYEYALADGVIGPDDFVTQVELQGRAGVLPRELAEIWDPYAKGIKSEREFRRQAIDYALSKVPGRNAYTSPAWQQLFLDHVTGAHRRKKPGKPGHPVVIDPLTGTSPDFSRKQIDSYFRIARRREYSHDIDGRYNIDDVYDFIADNLEDLSKPDHMLHAYVTPDGRLSLGVGKAVKSDLRLKPTGGTRVKLPWSSRKGDLYRDSGTADIAVNTAAGRIHLQGGFVGGEGDRFRRQASSRGPEDAWVDAVTDLDFARFVAGSQRWVDVGPDDWATYSVAWERAVNLHLANDPVARQFMSGRSYDDVIAWLHNTNEGRAYNWKMGPWRTQYAEHVAMIQAMVETYLPVGEAKPKAVPAAAAALPGQPLTAADIAAIKNAVLNEGKTVAEAAPRALTAAELDVLTRGIESGATAKRMRMEIQNAPAAPPAAPAPVEKPAYLTLREKALKGTVTVADLEKVVRRDQMPKVHGASLEYATGRGPIMDMIKRTTDKTFKILSDLPNDKLVRFPFAAERYRAHVEQLAKIRGVHLAKSGDTFSVSDLEGIERLARTRALRDVQRYLYHSNASWDLAKSLRLMVPFGSALADSFLKWGLVLRENPTAMLNVWKLWNAADRNGLVVDQDGNQLAVEEGEEVWYQVNPDTGERVRLEEHQPKDRYISFRLPSWLAQDHYGDEVRPMVRINKLVFQTFLDVPTAGPLIAVPASKFSLDHPEFAENKFVKQWILPNGPSADQSSIFVPSNLRNLRQQLLPGWFEQDRQTAEAQTVAIFAADMASYSLGQRQEPPTIEEAREKGAAMRGLRFWAAFAGVSPQVQSPYQPYVDYYRQLRLQEAELRQKAVAEGHNPGEVPSADELFYREMGDEFFSLTMAVTRNTLGIPATIEANNAYRKYQDLMERHPDIATLILGSEGAGEFSRAVYEAQKLRPVRPGSSSKQRERMSVEESWEDMQKRRGWIEYQKFMDLVQIDMDRNGFTNLQQAGAERLKEARQAFIAERMFIDSPWGETVMNPWFADFNTVDRSRMTARLHSMREIVRDSRLQGRDDIRGLIDYLSMRDRFRNYMMRSGYSSLDTDEAAMLKMEWMRLVFTMKNSNLSFAALYDRWLTADENLEAA